MLALTSTAGPRTPLLAELGVRLRQLRLDAGVTGAELAELCRVTQPTISKIERGRMTPTTGVLDRLLTELEAGPDVCHELHQLLDAAMSFGRELRRQQIVSSSHAAIVYRERTAHRVRCFAPMILPALLQTPTYATRLATGRPWFAHSADIAIGHRSDRQGLLCDPERRFEFILTEAALCCGPMTDAELRSQREHVNSLAGLANVRIRVVQADVSTRRLTLPWCSFAIYDDDLVAISTFVDDTLLVGPADIAAYTAAYIHLGASARDLAGASPS